VEKIIWLRQHYHFGPAKIAMYLGRYHDVTISVSGVWRILKRLGLNRLPASQRYRRHNLRWKRYEKQRPGHQLQLDVKFIEPLAPDRPEAEVLPVHRDRRLHPAPGAPGLPPLRPEDRHRLYRPHPVQAALRRRARPNRHSSLVVP
jgi:hypothetical protein